MNQRLKSWLLSEPFWIWYDRKCPEPYRFLVCLALVLPPIYILNGALHIELHKHVWIFYTALTYLFYLIFTSWWRLAK